MTDPLDGIEPTRYRTGLSLHATRPSEDGIPGVHEEVLEGSDVKPCRLCYLHMAEHELVEHLWRAEVVVAGEHRWAGNALTFATEDEAKAYVLDLAMRWTAVADYRAVSIYTPEHEEYTKSQ